MIVSNKVYKTIKVSALLEKIALNKKEKKLNVAFIDQNFLKRTPQRFVTIAGESIFLLKSKIGAMQIRAVVDVYINGARQVDMIDYTIRTSATDSSRSELLFLNYSFADDEEVVIVY